MRLLAWGILVLATASQGCGGDDEATTAGSASAASTGSGGAGGGGGSGGGGAPPITICAPDSPAAAPFGGDAACPAPMPAQPDALDAALAAGGVDRCAIGFKKDDILLSGWPQKMVFDARRLPDFTPLHEGALRLPSYGRETAKWVDAAATGDMPVSATIATLSARRSAPLAAACADVTAFEPAPDDATPLATAVLLLDEHHGAPGDDAAVKAAAANVPLALQQKLAPIVGAIDAAATDVDAALGDPANRAYLAHMWALYIGGQAPGFLTTQDAIDEADAVDLVKMAGAAAVVARAIEQADLASVDDATFDPFEVLTPLGLVSVHGSGADTYLKGGSFDHAALVVDLGGDDAYEATVSASDEKHPISIAIDVRGKDDWGYHVMPDKDDGDLLPSDEKGRAAAGATYGATTNSRVARQGAGMAGIGMLFDLGTEGDTYRSLALSQGVASAGVGVLYDAGGDDTYDAEIFAQGAALFGIGVLVDHDGTDAHRSFAYSQGFGGVQGVGALVDVAGDNLYFCDPGDPAYGGHPVYYSPQLPGKGNTSMCQGVAQGRRGDTPPYIAGGIGLLRDLDGADTYQGSVFAQGVGFWQGLGILMDGGSGADQYDALWYVQGSTAHYALSLFVDEGGDDRYEQTFVPAATSIGVGHDFSASLHLDLGGNDVYRAPGLSLGSGNINGIGLLVNVGGDDQYLAAGDPTLGAGNYSSEAPYGQPRQDAPTIGVFVDAGGSDTYTVGAEVRPLEGTTWSYEPQPYPAPQMVTTEHGCGNDNPTGTVELP